MVHTITVLNFLTGKTTVYKNVDLNGMDAEDWLRDNTDFDLDNCEWMATPASDFELEAVDMAEGPTMLDSITYDNDTL